MTRDEAIKAMTLQAIARSERTIALKACTTLTAARTVLGGHSIHVYDDCDGDLWLYGHEHGASMVIRAASFECAYGIAIDESPTIERSDLPEAYGFYGESAAADFAAAVKAGAASCDYPELVEGYRYQDNATGTGIVATGHHESLRPMTRGDCKHIRLTIGCE